ncbi:Uncharacterised protein [Mycobacteroides abscessus subsp. abscessus]|nr:Uncharacterised protein [Mycobacteroides abscessus subsp. abscessus]
MSAVSIMVTPASSAAWIVPIASASSIGPPSRNESGMAPRPTDETLNWPNWRAEFMVRS